MDIVSKIGWNRDGKNYFELTFFRLSLSLYCQEFRKKCLVRSNENELSYQVPKKNIFQMVPTARLIQASRGDSYIYDHPQCQYLTSYAFKTENA